MKMYDLILKKRDGGTLTKEEISYFINEYTKGNIPDYQVSALLMAIYFQNMNEEETVYLTEAMMNSGETIDLSAIEGVKVDKHSTGGVGDKTTIALAPIIAACGVSLAKMSGRGLGHTGGTLDKLESIPGFNINMSIEKFIYNVNKFKVAIAGQTTNLAPADKLIYALRDVTATVDNISLIASSIMCKKLASGADSILLDVKTGSGAFMKNTDDAFKLAYEMVKIGNNMNRRTIALVTNMNQPLGKTIGNSLEIKEAIQTLKDKGPDDFKELCITLASYMLLLAGNVETVEEGRKKANEVISNGKAFSILKTLVKEQGGDTNYIDNIDLLPKSKKIYKLKSKKSGYINKIDAEAVGLSALALGAGRETKDSSIDLAVGIVLNKKIGDYVEKDETLAYLHYNNEDKNKDAINKLKSAYTIEENKDKDRSLVFGIVTTDGIKRL